MQTIEETDFFSICKRIYHDSANIIKEPKFNLGKPNNDYGRGFYCTEDIERAREWAAGHSESVCYVNKYNLNTGGLKILNFKNKKYNILHWITVLLENRHISVDDLELAEESTAYLLDKYHIPLADFDVVIGYRADDSYFAYARTFVSGGFSLEGLKQAMILGHLGEQIVLVSNRAFKQIEFVGYEIVSKVKYTASYVKRDTHAKLDFKNRVYKIELLLYRKSII